MRLTATGGMLSIRDALGISEPSSEIFAPAARLASASDCSSRFPHPKNAWMNAFAH